VTAFTPHVLVDVNENEVGRCGMQRGVTFQSGNTVDLGPLGFFRILDVRNGEPIVLVVEPLTGAQHA
jgi:hypothetical protein